MRSIATVAAFAALSMTVTSVASPQKPSYTRDVPAALAAQAKISEDSAVKIALKQVPQGAIKSLELEREKGKLIWSMDLVVPGTSGIQEVNVDAITGAVVSVEHEAGGEIALAGYHVARRITLGGEGGWDYLTVDTGAHRLYVSRGTRVIVVSTDNEGVVGEIPNTPGVHGIAIAPDLGRGFTSNGRDSSVTVFDLKTLAVLQRIKVPARNPDAILYEPLSKRVFTFNGGSATATVIDATTGGVLGWVPLSGRPEFAVHDGNGKVFVNIEDRSEIMAFDARTLAIHAHWPLAPCQEPSGLAIDRAHGVLLSGCSNKLMTVLSIATGRVTASLPIGDGVDATAFDPATQTAFSSNGEGTFTVLKANVSGSFAVAETVPTQLTARTMALDERTHWVYTVAAEFGPAPAPTAENPRPRPPMIPGSFVILVLEP